MTESKNYQVSELVKQLQQDLEQDYAQINVEGEISNFSCPSSGHWYFSLKDSKAQLRCAMFKGYNRKIAQRPKDGAKVRIQGKISVYSPRGDLQLIATHIKMLGTGDLLQQFEQLKQQLQRQGLFATAHKQALPSYVQNIGVITSPTGAAIRDILSVLQRRFPAISVIIYPVLVQGETATQQISDMIAIANQRQEVEVLILARGGGSLEDLWCFNARSVAQAIYESKLPIVTGIGHEIDYTIADFVADQRAPTPSAAAELLSPDQTAWFAYFSEQQQLIQQKLQGLLQQRQQQLDYYQQRLLQQHPQVLLTQKLQRIEELGSRCQHAQSIYLRHLRMRLQQHTDKLQQVSPLEQIAQAKHRWHLLTQGLRQAISHYLQSKTHQNQTLSVALETVSPLATLHRGYAIVTDNKGQLVSNSQYYQIGDTIEIKLQQGGFQCEIKTIYIQS